jgi:hypothetical protein
MTINAPRMPRPMLVGLGSLLIAFVLAGGSALATSARFSPRVLAATLQQATGTTCAQAPTAEHCNNQDPELQGCAADAETIGQATIFENGFAIGRVERRWSLTCQSWWGRVFDDRPDSHADMSIEIAGTTTSAAPTFVSNQYRILYSPMIFDADLTTGLLTIDALTPPASATLAPIIPPGKK